MIPYLKFRSQYKLLQPRKLRRTTLQLAATETNFHELTLLDVSEIFKVSFKSSSTPVFHTHAQL